MVLVFDIFHGFGIWYILWFWYLVYFMVWYGDCMTGVAPYSFYMHKISFSSHTTRKFSFLVPHTKIDQSQCD